jgi:hypothetical protein
MQDNAEKPLAVPISTRNNLGDLGVSRRVWGRNPPPLQIAADRGRTRNGCYHEPADVREAMEYVALTIVAGSAGYARKARRRG